MYLEIDLNSSTMDSVSDVSLNSDVPLGTSAELLIASEEPNDASAYQVDNLRTSYAPSDDEPVPNYPLLQPRSQRLSGGDLELIEPDDDNAALQQTTLSASSPSDNDTMVLEFLQHGDFIEEFGHIVLTPEARKRTMNTDIYFFHTATRKPEGTEFWLMTAVMKCSEYATTAAMLENGAIQAAITYGRQHITPEIRVLLLILLRLAASCYTHAHLLSCVQSDIFEILFQCLKTKRSKPGSLDSMVLGKLFSDSRAYSDFLAIAYGAHSRPLNVQVDHISPEDREVYENHVQLVCHAYGHLFSRPKSYYRELPAHLAAFHDSFCVCDIAAETFIDLSPHGMFAHFAANIVEIKWDRCFNSYLEGAPFNHISVKLYQILNQSPLTVASHLIYPYSIYKHCFLYLSWGLRTILDNEFYRNPKRLESWNRPRKQVPLDFCMSCAGTLQSFLDSTALISSSAGQEVKDFMRNPIVINQLLRFVLAMPNIVEAKQDPRLDSLYSAVWSLIYSTSYTFPMMFNTLLSFVHDPTIPSCLGTQAAAYIAVAASFARFPLKRSDIVAVFKHLYLQLKRSSREPSVVVRRRQELVFRLAVILYPKYFGIGTPQHRRNKRRTSVEYNLPETSNIDVSGIQSIKRIFVPYDFQQDEE